MREGELVWTAHVGAARLGDGADGTGASVAATDSTQFMIGSVTKTFTALAVMALRDEGRLSLDDPLDAHVPGTRHARFQLRQMLAHASGLQREPIGNIWESLSAPEREAFLVGVEEAEQVLPAHHAFHYSNLAYGLLGQVVERVTGQDWETVVRERVLDPLGMARTGLVPPTTARTGTRSTRGPGRRGRSRSSPQRNGAARRPVVERRRHGPLRRLPRGPGRPGRQSGDDRRDVPAAHHDGRRRVDGRLRPGFGMGRRGDRVFVGHGGAMPGYLTGLRVRRRDKVGAIVFANATSGAEPLALATDLVEAVVNGEPPIEPAWVPEQYRPELTELLGQWWSRALRSPFSSGTASWSRSPTTALGDAVRAGGARPLEPAGRERGEVLQVVRAADGTVAATLSLCRRESRWPSPISSVEGTRADDSRSGRVLSAVDCRLGHPRAPHLERPHDGVEGVTARPGRTWR